MSEEATPPTGEGEVPPAPPPPPETTSGFILTRPYHKEYYWTKEMDDHLISILNRPGCGFEDASKELGRTTLACNRRIHILEKMQGMKLYPREFVEHHYRPWTEREEHELVNLHREHGQSFIEIGKFLGRTSYACLRKWEAISGEERKKRKYTMKNRKKPASAPPPPEPPPPAREGGEPCPLPPLPGDEIYVPIEPLALPQLPLWTVSTASAFEMMQVAGYSVEEKVRSLRAFRLFLDTLPRTDERILHERRICTRIISCLDESVS